MSTSVYEAIECFFLLTIRLATIISLMTFIEKDVYCILALHAYLNLMRRIRLIF